MPQHRLPVMLKSFNYRIIQKPLSLEVNIKKKSDKKEEWTPRWYHKMTHILSTKGTGSEIIWKTWPSRWRVAKKNDLDKWGLTHTCYIKKLLKMVTSDLYCETSFKWNSINKTDNRGPAVAEVGTTDLETYPLTHYSFW